MKRRLVKCFNVFSVGFILTLYVINDSLQYTAGKEFRLKTLKRLPKTQVDIKSFIHPCTKDDNKFFNSSYARNSKYLANCKRKLVIKMTINSVGECGSKSDGFIAVDQITDATTGRKKRLFNPLIIRIKREKMYQLYDIHHIKTVNAEAKEEIINFENKAKFSGCDISSSHPTCGFTFYKNKIVQFSEGFCCSCDQEKNELRQPCDDHDGKEESTIHRRVERDFLDKSDINYEHDTKAEFIANHKMESDLLDKADLNYEDSGKEVDLKEHMISDRLERDLGDGVDINLEGENEFGQFEKVQKNDGSQNIDNTNQDDKSIPKNDIYFEKNSEVNDFLIELSNSSSNNVELDSKNIPENPSSTSQNSFSDADFVIGYISKSNEKEINHNSSYSNDTELDEIRKILMINKIKNRNERKVTRPIEVARRKRSITDITVLNNTTSLPSFLQTQQSTADSFLLSRSGDYISNKSFNMCPIFFETTMINQRNASTKEVSESINKNSVNSSKQENETYDNFNTVSEFEKYGNLSKMEDILLKLVPVINMDIANPENSKTISKNLPLIEHIIVDLNKTNNNDTKVTPFMIKSNSCETGNVWNKIEVTAGNKLGVSDSNLKSELLVSTPMPSKDQANIRKREVVDKQFRGGQSCPQENITVPPDANPDTYFESAHCLRYSDLWYNVHKITNPRLENSITIKVFSKHRKVIKKACWENLTKHISGRVGTSNEVQINDAGTLVIYYSSNDKPAFSIDCTTALLFVPQSLPKRCKNSELKAVDDGGPEEYLILKESDVTFDGDKCDLAGVGFSAFFRQPRRCERLAGTCLHNQPLQFWRRDKKLRNAGKKGQYFLRNYITITDQPILQNAINNQVVLKAPYEEHFQSQVVVEMNADNLDIVGDRSEGQVTEVYIDATQDKVTKVKAVITNMGIVTDYFGVDFANCTTSLGLSNFDKSCKDEIPPQHRITYTATISTPLPNKRIYCKLVVYSLEQEVVAYRTILIVKGQHCMCVWYCECICYSYPHPDPLPCKPITIKEYNNAGFPGQLPVTTSVACSILFNVLLGVLWLILFLLLFGLLKALIGLCISAVAAWGLWYLFPEEAQKLCAYMEPKLYHYTLVRDICGFPIHPRSFNRTVQFLPWYTEFIVNIFFFICVLRTYFCDNLCERASSMKFPHKQQPCPSPRQKYHHCPPIQQPFVQTSRYSDQSKFRLLEGGAPPYYDSLAGEQAARRVVQYLVRAYVVYRNFDRPMGGVSSNPGQQYSVRGYFLESDNGVYQFSPPSPLIQIRSIDNEFLEPPKILDPIPFTAIYHSALEVLREGQLNLYPKGTLINAP